MIPLDCHQCSVCKTIGKDRLRLLSSNRSHLYDSVEEAAAPTAFHQHLESLPQDARWAISWSRCADGGASVARAFQAGTFQAVSDGSLKGGFGTSAFVLETPGETSNHIQGVNIVPAPLAEGDSHHCELASLYAILLVSQAVCKTHNITQGKAAIACDNKQAISMFNEWYVPDPQDANFDLTSAIWKLLQDSPIQWRNIHVKGHQDDHLHYDKLNRIAQLNVEMDRLSAGQLCDLQTRPVHVASRTAIYGFSTISDDATTLR